MIAGFGSPLIQHSVLDTQHSRCPSRVPRPAAVGARSD